jgi:hypothetical protein
MICSYYFLHVFSLLFVTARNFYPFLAFAEIGLMVLSQNINNRKILFL